MTYPVVDTVFTQGTTITSEWLNGVNDYVNESNPSDHSAANVTYDPPFTGAVATNVEAKLAQTVSVMDFGAVGDGVTDNTTAIQNAIDYLDGQSGGTVYFPAGTYATSSTIQLKENVCLLGDGRRKSIILQTTDSIVSVSQAPTEAFSDIQNLGFAATGTTGVTLLKFDGGGQNNVVSCNFANADVAIEITDCYYNNIQNSYFRGLDSKAIYIHNTSNANNVNGCRISTVGSGGTGIGIHVTGTSSNTNQFYGNTIESVSGIGISIDGAYFNTLIGNYLEACTVDDIVLSGTTSGNVLLQNFCSDSATRTATDSRPRGNIEFSENTTSGNAYMRLGGFTYESTSDTHLAVNSGSAVNKTLSFTNTTIKSPDSYNEMKYALLAGFMVAADVNNNSIFINTADNKLYFKDNSGTIHALY